MNENIQFIFTNTLTWTRSLTKVPAESKDIVLFNQICKSFKKNKQKFNFIATTFASPRALKNASKTNLKTKIANDLSTKEKELFEISLEEAVPNPEVCEAILTIYSMMEKGYNHSKFVHFLERAAYVVNALPELEKFITGTSIVSFCSANELFDLHIQTIQEIKKLKEENANLKEEMQNFNAKILKISKSLAKIATSNSESAN
jgi:hypothetical protein